MRISRCALLLRVSVVAMCLPLAPCAFGQIQSTISCPAENGYWDVLSVMMMDPGLASNYHMEGITGGLPSSYVYTMWDSSQDKVYYVKNPQGNPWDINLYDSSYVYQWVTELGVWNGVNHWNDPTSCRKFNNGSQNSSSDRSMRWAARCAVPGGRNSSFWNPPPSTQPNNTNYYTYVGQEHRVPPQNLEYSWLELKPTGTTTSPTTGKSAATIFHHNDAAALYIQLQCFAKRQLVQVSRGLSVRLRYRRQSRR